MRMTHTNECAMKKTIDNPYTHKPYTVHNHTRNVWPTNHIHAIDIGCTLCFFFFNYTLCTLDREEWKPFLSIWNACFKQPFKINMLSSSSSEHSVTAPKERLCHVYFQTELYKFAIMQRTEGGAVWRIKVQTRANLLSQLHTLIA